MKVVIFCGGEGTRLREITERIPKPLVEIGGKPILWHLMKIYSYYGFNEFILCLGYKGDLIKKYFLEEYKWKNSNFSLNLGNEGGIKRYSSDENWNITFVDTGLNATKSERLKRVKEFLDGDNFFVSYGDDLADIDLKKLVDFHSENKSMVTLCSLNKVVIPFGVLEMDNENTVKSFKEKPHVDVLINGGFYVFNKKIFDYLDEGELESEVFKKLISLNEIKAYKHTGLWKSMNTFKDSVELNDLWSHGKAWWRVWK